MLVGIVNSLVKVFFGDKGGKTAALINLVSYIVVLFLVLFIGQQLWNTILVELVDGIRPVKNIWELLGLQVLVGLLLCN